MPAKKEKVIENKCERIINEYRYSLSLDQQLYLEKNVDSKDILKLTRDCFDDITLDEHSTEYNKVKNFLVKFKRNNQVHNFSDSQIEFITDNGLEMRPMEIARALFPDSKSLLNKEAQTIALLLEALDIHCVEPTNNDELANGDYMPPRTDHKIIEIINRADSGVKYHISQLRLDPKRKECVTLLKRNMNSPRFVMIANSITRKKLREFFETEFARAAYDKPDLTADETNQYISLCKAYVDEIILSESISSVNDRINEIVMDDEGKKHLFFTEALETKTKEAKELRTFIKQLQHMLSGSRKDRLDKLASLNDSLIRFVQLAEVEKGREQYTRIQMARNEELAEEMKNLNSHSALIAEIYGVKVQEILNF